MALVSLPGSSTVEKFAFTVRDEQAAAELVKVMGKRVTVHYEEKVGLPTSCFGDTRHYVTAVTLASDTILPIAVYPYISENMGGVIEMAFLDAFEFLVNPKMTNIVNPCVCLGLFFLARGMAYCAPCVGGSGRGAYRGFLF